MKIPNFQDHTPNKFASFDFSWSFKKIRHLLFELDSLVMADREVVLQFLAAPFLRSILAPKLPFLRPTPISIAIRTN